MSNLMKQNTKIVLIGMPGCGKSTIGKILSRELGMDFYDLDKYIEVMENKSIPDIFLMGEPYFRLVERRAVKAISKDLHCVISTGGGIVKTPECMQMLKKDGTVIYINRPLKDIVQGINTEGRPLLKNNINNIYKLYEERKDLYKMYCDYEIINDRSAVDAVQEIIKLVI